ncbi:ABC transporter-related protein [Natrinema pellirubrum DSM 15624]|uniref:ABC transporter-related protein n=1 Tax=Natrinema pellirubrum (strain DSM 15624 / CIP 106293 / JCM 10476 / NCIMB 786 / 157) TaxID=797303 RepID=L0JMI5_NATP1|nr:ABC transporter ATP-binding protein [Natrinema pellirubrum]AGB32745.1 ABC-type multidrug transport system, ATPase component [Natrinema pellirubrum DSM 15624]ELY75748.1 ABC transporter-related protein [Natrinema pellirubrum DSM 15624]
MEAVVDATDLEKVYGETVALSGASLSVAQGEVFALIGPNGAGKTTLVRSLTGTTEPDGGTAAILSTSPAAVDRDRLGVLPQEFSPPARLSARELLAYYAGLYEDPRDPADVLADVGLADAGDTWYENLSGGQQRRVCVGSALVNDPDLLFLDEPTTGIDPAGRRTVWRLIEDLADAGTTVVLTTHDMAEAEHLADRVGLLADGSLVAQGPPEDLVREYGGSSRLTVETAADPAAFDDLEYPVERPERGRDRTPEAAVVVREIDPAAIGSVVDYLEANGIEYTGLSWAEPDLEDVYLALAEPTERERTAPLEGGSGDAAADDSDLAQAGETA